MEMLLKLTNFCQYNYYLGYTILQAPTLWFRYSYSHSHCLNYAQSYQNYVNGITCLYGNEAKTTSKYSGAFPALLSPTTRICISHYRKTGLTQFAPKGSKIVDNLLVNVKKFDLPVNMVDAKEAKDKCPYISVPDNFVGVFEEDAGILATSKCVTALQVKYIKYVQYFEIYSHDSEIK